MRRTSCTVVLVLAACSVSNSDDPPKQDTSVLASRARAGSSGDSITGVPAVPTESAGTSDSGGATLPPLAGTPPSGAPAPAVPDPAPSLTGRSDTGRLVLYPATPRRGGVLFAFSDAVAGSSPQCQWAGKPIPCYNANGGTLALIPLPADEPAQTHPLVLGQPAADRAAPIRRSVSVAETDFGREAILLDKTLYALVKKSGDIARDSRAIRRVLSGETRERYWRGAWRDPIRGAKGTGYGVERFYYPKSDSLRTIKLESTLKARASFGLDTITTAADVPSWRHAGVDIAAKKGASILAPQHGMVAEVGDYTLSGRTLLLDHGQGVYSAFFHLDTVVVRKGDVVTPGKIIARVGATGLATGPHLHYGIYVHGKDVNPAAFRDIPAFARGDSASAPRKGR